MNLEGLVYIHRHAAPGFQLQEVQTMTRWTRTICLARRRLFLTSLEQSPRRLGCNKEESVTYKYQSVLVVRKSVFRLHLLVAGAFQETNRPNSTKTRPWIAVVDGSSGKNNKRIAASGIAEAELICARMILPELGRRVDR